MKRQCFRGRRRRAQPDPRPCAACGLALRTPMNRNPGGFSLRWDPDFRRRCEPDCRVAQSFRIRRQTTCESGARVLGRKAAGVDDDPVGLEAQNDGDQRRHRGDAGVFRAGALRSDGRPVHPTGHELRPRDGRGPHLTWGRSPRLAGLRTSRASPDLLTGPARGTLWQK